MGEWLLGNQPLSQLPALVLLAPMYGGGALLVREVGRRTGRGWPAIALLAAAYALLEEGPIDQMIYNPAYLGLDSFDGMLEIPRTGTSLSLVLASLALHTVWSICTPIALVESFDRTGGPWLRTRGLIAVAAVFVLASALLTWAQADEFDFFASPGQLGGDRAGHRRTRLGGLARAAPGVRPGLPPGPVVVGVVAFAVTGCYWAESLITSYVVEVSPWLDVLTWCGLVGLGVGLVITWSRRPGWGVTHRAALACGALLTYAWVGYANGTELEVPRVEAVAGNILFSVLAVGLVAGVARSASSAKMVGVPAD